MTTFNTGAYPPGVTDNDPHFDCGEPPEQWVDCPRCEGKGYTVHRVTVYEHGCGFPHDDGEERKCEKCEGQGGWPNEMRSDLDSDYCPYRMFTEEEEAGWERVFADIDENGRPKR